MKYQSISIWDNIRNDFKRGSMVTRLIYLNVAVFVLINLGLFIINQFEDVMIKTKFENIFMLPGDLNQLIRRPYTLITHMFSHYGILHILFNMLWLYWMGRILSQYLGDKKILPLYIMGGLVGAVFYLLSFNIFPGFADSLAVARALGASAAVMAITIATATLLPNFTIFIFLIGPVKLKWIAFVVVILDIVGINGLNAGGSIAHLGGAFFGYIFIVQLRKGNDYSETFYKVVNWFKVLFVGKKGPRVAYKKDKGNTKNRTKHKQGYSQSKQERIDAILDKIASSGYDSLSKEEKEFLFRVSKEDE